MAMKKAEKYIEDFWGVVNCNIDSAGRYISGYDIAMVIKAAQINAIEETVKLCAEKVKLYYTDLEQTELNIDIDSILNCAEILKKEIE